MELPRLFHAEHLPVRLAYQRLFSHLPALQPHRPPASPQGGRPAIDRNALLRALIYRALRRLTSLSDLVQALRENPALLEAIGLDPLGDIPSLERFSDWLRSTPNESLQEIRIQLLQALFAERAFTGRILALDSCPIPSPVRENNLKTAVRDRFNKLRLPKGDRTARLGVLTSFARGDCRKVVYFWGYRNHVVVDTETELPLWERTEPADRKESPLAVPLLRALLGRLPLPIEAICADSAYDADRLLKFTVDELHAQPVVAPHPRRHANPDFRIQGSAVVCPANLEMFRRGKMTPRRTRISYIQFSCPIHYDRSLQQRFLVCPVAHPKFFQQKGCNYLLRISPNIRLQIPYGSGSFRQLYRERTAVERAFSRLLTIAMQDLPTRGLDSARNLCTIAHITVLLVALAAHRSGCSDQLAFVRSFVPNLIDTGPEKQVL
jgi:transposase